ncbi:MAG TPA: isoprenylcysteine carboxylmethyltransferase family protein [Steroidobacteraceae bacterium]|nr:isoprenylcysteine carboxylmethyltransferase family protein [Steroidobacteraceae bacterium]
MAAILALYSTVVYVLFLGTFLYAIGFVEGVLVPKTIDSGPAGGVPTAIVIDAVLLGIFALQHSIMARPAFKRVWTRIVPEAAERSTYVLFATAALALICWQWQPLPRLVWSVDQPTAAAVIRAISWGGWGILLISTFLISHWQLFGLSQGFGRLFGRAPHEHSNFATPFFYRWLRHPIYAGFILAFWAAPHMSVGHLLFAALSTGYILVGIWFEERDLIAQFGERYESYRQRVGMLIPKLRGGFRTPVAQGAATRPGVGGDAGRSV